MSDARVDVWRGALIESRHRVHVAVVDAGGVLRAAAGAASIACYARSAVKPFQALPLVEDGVAARFGFTAADLAVCCASHSGEPTHVRTVRGMLGRIGVEEEALACGPHEPFHDESARCCTPPISGQRSTSSHRRRGRGGVPKRAHLRGLASG
jgi:L-asparaginase II